MPFPHPRLVQLLPGFLAVFFAGAAARAQIHEEAPTPGLEEGILLEADADILAGRAGEGRVQKPIGSGDFSIVINTRINHLTDAFLFACRGQGAGWSLKLARDGAVELTGTKGDVKVGVVTPPHVVAPQTAVQIVASVKRDARQPNSGIWIDGIEVASAAVPPVDCNDRGDSGCRADTDKLPFIAVRVYNRALTRPEILELGLRSSRREEAQTSGSPAAPGAQKSAPPHVGSYPKSKHPAPPPNGPRFIPQPDETIALIGGTEAVSLAESGELEALLLMAFPGTRFHFRSLAWEGDTVFKQDRPMNFGSLEQQLRRVNAGAAFVMFGRQECLDAKDEGKRMKDEKSKAAADSSFIPHPSSLDSFKTAFEKLLTEVEKVTPNIVVIGPLPFEKKEPPLPDLSPDDKALQTYAGAVQELASRHGAGYAGLGSFLHDPRSSGWTRDGVTLSEAGNSALARAITEALNAPLVLNTGGLIADDDAKARRQLRATVAAKNRLWHHYWRPSNWAFLHGDRTGQPSSRDPVNPQIRFFPAEQEMYLPLIKEAEDRLFKLAEGAQKKLP